MSLRSRVRELESDICWLKERPQNEKVVCIPLETPTPNKTVESLPMSKAVDMIIHYLKLKYVPEKEYLMEGKK